MTAVKQNIYDDPGFFAKYGAMERSIGGLDGAEEWPAFRALLPDLAGKRVLDLGCGFGWHCRFARAQRAAYVLGVDLSEKMLAQARATTADPQIQYQRVAVEDFECEEAAFDVVVSSLVLHDVEPFDSVCRNVHRALAPGGAFVFSVEHPIFTSCAAQQWHVDADGHRRHWPVDDYHEEGIRHTHWMADDVVKYHRTIASYVNTTLEAGFRLDRLLELGVSAERAAAREDLRDERRRPMFLVIAASKRTM